MGFSFKAGMSFINLEYFNIEYYMWGIFLSGSNSHVSIVNVDASNCECGVRMTIGEAGNPWYGPVEYVDFRDCSFHENLYIGIDGTPGPCNHIQIESCSFFDNGESSGFGADGVGIEVGDHITTPYIPTAYPV